MSININVNGMNYVGESYAQRAEREKRCKNRLLKVRVVVITKKSPFIDFRLPFHTHIFAAL